MQTKHKTASPADAARKLKLDIRYDIIAKTITDPEWTAERAAELLHLTVRQVYRLKAKVAIAGRAGLVHGNQGRKPPSTLPDALHHRVVNLYDTEFGEADYNYSHFTTALTEEYQITVSRETVRQWLRAADWGRKPRRYYPHRTKRERCARPGQMLFLDGSPHRWFGPDFPRSTLLLTTDDATGHPLAGLIKPHEDRDGCFAVFYKVAQKQGLPERLYLDRGSVFKTTRHGGLHAQQLSDDATAFQIAMRKLGVQIIFAYSPQARGRGERINGSFQGRLVPEFRRQGIHELESANQYLNEIFIPRYQRWFGVAPRDSNPAFRPVPVGLDLRCILCKESVRRVQTDNTIRLNGRTYQLLPARTCTSLYASEITVQEWFDGTVHVYHRHQGEIPNRLIPVVDIYRLANRHDRNNPTDKITLP